MQGSRSHVTPSDADRWRGVRRWWSARVDYAWVVNYHRSHPFLSRAPIGIALCCVALGAVSLTIAWAAHDDGQGTLGVWVPILGAIGAAVLAAGWSRSTLPSRTRSLAFVAAADVLIIGVLLSQPPTPIILLSTVMLVPVGDYANAFHGPRTFAVHVVVSVALAVVQFVRVVLDSTESTITTVGVLGVVAAVMLSASVLNHVFLDALRNDAARAYFDQLTGLRNRRGFFADARILVHEAFSDVTVPGALPGSTVMSAICMDLDSFKSVNDRYGHATGDDVLRTTAARIDRACADRAICARFGGEEFVAVVIGDAERGAETAANLREAIHIADDVSPVSASIGVASLVLDPVHRDGHDSTALLRRLLDEADRAMYDAKRGGGDRVVHQSIT